MFDYLTTASVINLKKFTVDSINYIGWESNFSIKPPRFYIFNEHEPVREAYLKDGICSDFSQ